MAFNLDLYYSWKKYFDSEENVEIIDGDILKEKADAIVSPANSFGYMDGGLDLKYSKHFGWELEAKVREKLEDQYFGEIPVGQALIVETGRSDIPYLISAPTMRVPSNVSDTVNAYLAFKGILQSVIGHNQRADSKIESILCPGLGTGEGRMKPEDCARQMHRAYDVCVNKNYVKECGLVGAVNDHLSLLRKP